MAEAPTPSSGHGIKGFMTGSTMGLPNWAWILIVGGGIAAAYFLPKLLGSSSSSSSSTPTTGTGTGTSGIGLAIDPTTGLPYAVEGLVPSGASAGMSSGIGQTGPTGAAGAPGAAATLFNELPQGTLIWQQNGKSYYETPGGTQKLLQGGPGAYLPDNAQVSQGGDGRWWASIGGQGQALVPTYGSQVKPVGAGQEITVPSWPTPEMTLAHLASQYGLTITKLEQLNPGIGQTLKSGEKVKIA
jgi:hypothetical protein